MHVFRACCMKTVENPWESFELGRVKFTEGGGVYESVVQLDMRRFDERFAGWNPQVVSVGYVWRDETSGRWTQTESRTWIVANNIDGWLLSEGGAYQHLSDVLIRKYGYPTQDDDGIPGAFEGWGFGQLARPIGGRF